MRALFTLAGLACLLMVQRQALADCPCPDLTLDDRINGAVTIFGGHPLVSAPIPGGDSPFHSEQSLEAPRAVPNNLVTLFRVETTWKGEVRKTIKVRHEQGACGASFKADVPVIVFAQMDAAGILWTRACGGNAAQGDANYDSLRDSLTNRLRYN
jgi:hypothetical protein